MENKVQIGSRVKIKGTEEIGTVTAILDEKLRVFPDRFKNLNENDFYIEINNEHFEVM